MTDIKNALAQLRAARELPASQAVAADAPAPSGAGTPTPDTAPEASAPSRGEVKTLAGRVPLALHRELTRALLDASEELRVSRVNVDEALEAAMRLVLRDPEVTARWHAQLRDVRRERREG